MALTGWPAMADDDGTGQTGTVVNKSLFDSIQSALEAYIVSGTNPTITPKAIIDEVVAAREGEVSLDAKLDLIESLIGVGSVSEATVKLFLGSRNVVVNGDFEDWHTVPSDTVDGWAGLSGAGATLVRTGIGQADTFHFGTTQYAAKVSRAAADAALEYVVVSTTDLPAYANIKGQKFSASVKCKAGTALQAKLLISDGITSTSSSFHTGGGTEEHLSATHTISNSATELRILLMVVVPGSAYFGGAQGIFSPLAPSDWQPLSQPQLAGELVRGIVSLQAQEFSGQKSLNQVPRFGPGTTLGIDTANWATASGRIHSNVVAVGNVGAGTDDLMTYTLASKSLDGAGKGLRIVAWGSFAANANAKVLTFSFGGGTPLSSESLAFNASKWRVEVDIIWLTNTTAKCVIRMQIGGTADMVATENYINVATISGLDFAGADTIIKFTGAATANDDIVQEAWWIELVG